MRSTRMTCPKSKARHQSPYPRSPEIRHSSVSKGGSVDLDKQIFLMLHMIHRDQSDDYARVRL